MTKAILKSDLSGNWMMLDKSTSQFLPLRGANALNASPLPLDGDIDLTKPIAEQVLVRDLLDRRSVKG